jgi:hypothetical protein
LRAGDCPYLFEVQATGDTVPQHTSEFEVGLEEQATGSVLGPLTSLYMRCVTPQQT